MNQIKTLVLLQLKDKIDFSSLIDKKTRIRTVIFAIIKFLIITAVSFLIMFFSCIEIINIFTPFESPRALILVMSFLLILSIISCTYDLMKNLYFAEDNRVLITLPVNSNLIFISKIIVFEIYELKKSFSFLIPITFGCLLFLALRGVASFAILIWCWLPMLFIITIPVVVGAVLSIPLMYIYRFVKKYTVLQLILFAALLGGGIAGIVYLINLIPENINLMSQWAPISDFIGEFLLSVETKMVPFRFLIEALIGEKSGVSYHFTWWILLKTLVIIAFDVVVLLIGYFTSRPLFFKMMAKNFELNKNEKKSLKNRRLSKHWTFINKEFKINIRTIEISVNYLIVYIVVPLMILLLNALYKAMDTRELGNWLIYTFNMLIICLPMLASNALVATYYSREGRAAYLKKVKPIYALYPLFVKILFNMLFSIPSVFASCYIFGNSAEINPFATLLIAIAVLLLHFGHMIWSAMLDIMNPQNEQYATTGITVDNPNENFSTILAFIISILFAVISYKIFSEVNLYHWGMFAVGIRLMIVSGIFFGGILMLFIKRIKAYYYEIQG